ncbi:ferredoxin [Nocardia sp. NPDC051570]|uniref:ferredoxin n=1 Tax=Nocardia sp. NPDC051570 TaxID=3364324 RepID=UPI0037B3F8A3
MPVTRVDVDRDVCQSSGHCARTAPTVFAATDAQGNRVTGPIEVPRRQAELGDTAAWECPAGAIVVSPH